MNPGDSRLLYLMNEALSCEYSDIATLFVYVFTDTYFVPSKNLVISYYVRKILWTKSNTEDLIDMIKGIGKIYKVTYDYYLSEVDSAKDYFCRYIAQKKVNKVKRLTDCLNQSQHYEAIAKIIKLQIINEEILHKLDNNKKILPIKDNKVIDFETQVVRERKMGDYCTYECNLDYELGPINLNINDFTNYFQ